MKEEQMLRQRSKKGAKKTRAEDEPFLPLWHLISEAAPPDPPIPAADFRKASLPRAGLSIYEAVFAGRLPDEAAN
jgi:hypothetical protein